STGESVSIEVVDDGPGLPSGSLEEFSVPYLHAHAEPGQPQRLGLGLSVALQVARAMDATLTYRRSETSTFQLTFPQPGQALSDRPSEATTGPVSDSGSPYPGRIDPVPTP